MEKLVAELKNLVLFKETTTSGDIVLLASEEPQMLVYAVVKGIEPDRTRKEAWWNVTLQVLAIPPREAVWTLREPQFTGKEIFTFGGVEHFMKAVQFETSPPPFSPPGADSKNSSGSSRNRLRVVK